VPYVETIDGAEVNQNNSAKVLIDYLKRVVLVITTKGTTTSMITGKRLRGRLAWE
jgi:hypothetical protein